MSVIKTAFGVLVNRPFVTGRLIGLKLHGELYVFSATQLSRAAIYLFFLVGEY